MIDLAAYATEVEAFAKLASDFVAKASVVAWGNVERELRAGITAAQPQWTWQTHGDISFAPSNLYDGPGRNHVDTWLDFGFRLDFVRPSKTSRKSTTWRIASSATHISVKKEGAELPFHLDYKNSGQWGPQLHFQVAEALGGGIPIPRVPTFTFLPTDCLDLALSELHHEDWRKKQFAGPSSTHVATIRDGQEHRTKAYLRNVEALWSADRKVTRVCMLQDYTATLDALPDHNNHSARW